MRGERRRQTRWRFRKSLQTRGGFFSLFFASCEISDGADDLFRVSLGALLVERARFFRRAIEKRAGARRLFTPSRAIAFARFMEITPAAEAASDKPFSFSAADTARVAKKLSWHTGKAAWTFGTSFLLLVVPLIIQLHREEQMMALEQEQLSVLNSGGAAASSEPAK
jgi:import receptor subunit TOM22